MMTYGLISFESTTMAMKAEGLLLEAFDVETIPTPTQLSHSCGVSIKLELSLLPDACGRLQNQQVTGVRYYEVSGERGNRSYKEVSPCP